MFFDFGLGFFWTFAGISLLTATFTGCVVVIWTRLDDQRTQRSKAQPK